jgi:hypothetical protein
MTSRLIAATVLVAAAITFGLSVLQSAPAGAQLDSSVQSSVFDAATNTAWSGSEITGATAYDTATVVVTGVTPTGNLTYSLFSGNACTGTPISTEEVTLNANGTVPNSSTSATLAGGTYSFQAVYDGDSNYNASPPDCEAFTVDTAPSTIGTTVFDVSTGKAWSGAETTGASAEDTATIGGTITGFIPSGTVTYDYFGTGSCTGSVVATSTMTLNADGSVPASSPTGALGAGTYDFDASYSGDDNYAPSGPSSCESFTVGKATASLGTTVFDAGTNKAWSGSETTGASAYDTAALSGVAGFTPSGTVTYDYFGTGSCTGSVVASTTVTLNPNGSVPPSDATGALGAGNYNFDASYSGDGNYAALGPSSCEPFSLGLAVPTVTTTVFDASTNAAWAGTEVTGATAYDTATVTGSGITPTGTVTYQFFTGTTCTGTPVSTDQETITGGVVPDSKTTSGLTPMTYAFDAQYGGDGNYSSTTSSCETFTVDKATPSTATVVDDASTGLAWSGSEVTGATAYDTATVTGVAFALPTGTVVYTYFTNGTCSGPGTTQGVTLSGGAVPHSATTASLGAGSYSYEAQYNGDSDYLPGAASGCEPFSVAKATPPAPTTVVNDANSNSPWAGTETTGATAYDTAMQAGTGVTPTGTVTYSFFTNGTCAGSPSSTDGVALSAGVVPNSSTTSALGVGTYSFEAQYGGDGNYDASAFSFCEPFSVAQGTPSVATVVDDAATSATWSGAEVTGASAYDTSTVTGATGVPPTGTVTYRFFQAATCTGTPGSTDPQTLSGGLVPHSTETSALGAATYAFDAAYGGDTNYAAVTSTCETFTVGKATPSTATVVFDAMTNAPWSGSEATNAEAYDTATVTGVTGFTPSGTVTYSYFTNGTCAGTPSSTDGVVLSAGVVPHSNTTAALAKGGYSFEADYGGDSNYNASPESTCEPFSVGLSPTSVSTSVFDAGTNAAWSNTEDTGAAAYDTSTLTAGSITPTGTMTYSFFATGNCTGTPSTDPVTLSGGRAPNSSSTAALAAGSYSFSAQYGGDSNYAASPPGACEPFTVGKATAAAPGTVVNDGSTNAPWSYNEVTGAIAYDTSTVTGVAGFTPTGTVTYAFFTNGTCTGTASSTDVQTISDGLVPNSTPTSALAPGTYAFDATYGGDANYAASAASTCEPFSVAKATPMISTVVFDAATNTPWGTEVAPATAYDTATVTGVTGFTVTGTVTYSFFQTGTCTGTPSTDQVTLAGGTVPQSGTTSPLNGGSYSYDAVYGGDTNYAPSVVSACEPFGVAKKAPTIPSISNIPSGAQFGGSFSAAVDTTSDGVKSLATTTSGICSVSANVNVSFVGVGTCTLTAQVAASSDYFGATGNPQSFSVGRASTSAPSITNLPFNPVAEGGFTASVGTDGDGQRSVVSSTPGVCTVGGDGLTVTYVTRGTCTLTAQVSQGPTHLGATGSPQTFTILPVPHGYWLVGSDGGIFTFGNSQFWGSTGNITLQRPVVGITPTGSRNGYWLVASDGGIFSFGDAGFYGSIPGVGLHPAGSGVAPSLNAPIVAMVPSATGHGYFMVASDGGVFAFGDARFAGSCPGIGGCSGSAVAVVPDPTGNGYWLFTDTGNVYAFGDAPSYGSDPGTGVAVTSAVATPDGRGYWILFSNGAIANFGDAPNLGSPLGYTNSANPATTIFPTENGGGYWVGSARGDVFAYGDAPFLGSMAGTVLNGMIIAASGY